MIRLSDDHAAPGIDLDKLVPSRLGIVAASGGGKSYAVRRLLEQSYGQIQHVVIDPEGEYFTLAQKYDYLIIGGEHGAIPIDAESAPALALEILRLGVSCIIDLSEARSSPEQQKVVAAFLKSVMEAPRELWHPALIVIDEAARFVPEGPRVASSEPIIQLATQGRKRGYCLTLCMQRLSRVSKHVTVELANWLIGRTGQKDLSLAADMIGASATSDVGRALYRLQPGHFIASGPAIMNAGAEPRTLKVGNVQTRHLTTKGGNTAPTPPSAEEAARYIVTPKLHEPEPPPTTRGSIFPFKLAACAAFLVLVTHCASRPEPPVAEPMTQREILAVCRDALQKVNRDGGSVAFREETVKTVEQKHFVQGTAIYGEPGGRTEAYKYACTLKEGKLTWVDLDLDSDGEVTWGPYHEEKY